MNWLRDHMREELTRAPAGDQTQNVVHFRADPAPSRPGPSNALDLVSQAEAAVKPDGGRVLLRYSGTEQKARLLIEGRDAAVLEQWSKRICTELKNQIGA